MKRNEKIDVIKGVAIILVVYGHALQYGSGETVLKSALFFENPIFKFIYSFHMPLFMVVTGYLFSFSVKKYSVTEIVKSRVCTLIVPICTWSLIPVMAKLVNGCRISILEMLEIYINTIIKELWYLWAIFYCSLIVMIVSKYMNDRVIMYILVFIITFFVTDDRNISLYKYMYPFFILGYYYGLQGDAIRLWWMRNRNKILLVLIGIYVVMFFRFGYDSYIYTSGYCILGKEDVWKQVVINIYRLAIGCIGSFIIIGSIDVFYSLIDKKIIKIIAYLGRNSMGIYVFSGAIFNYALPKLTSNFGGINYITQLVESAMVICFSLLFSLVIRRHKILQQLFLGGRF